MNAFDFDFTPMWEKLKKETRPILLYGMGNGADKILACCEKENIKISGVFASDGFVKNKCFHGMPIRSYGESKKTFGEDIVVLLAFASSLPNVLENIKKINSEVTLYAPDVPVYGETLFDINFFEDNKEKFELVYSSLEDERSKELYLDIIKYKLSGRIEYLLKTDEESSYMHNILSSDKFNSFVDAGAYKGDTILRQKLYSPHLSKIFAIEPDPATFKKLCAINDDENNFFAFNCGLSDRECEILFHSGGGRGSSVNSKGDKIISLCKLDSLLGEEKDKIDFIKYDVEGSEYEALLGSFETIKASFPSMLISLYHRSEDLFKLPLFIKEKFPGYKLYLRKLNGIPAWDINLLCIPK